MPSNCGYFKDFKTFKAHIFKEYLGHMKFLKDFMALKIGFFFKDPALKILSGFLKTLTP